MIYPISTNANIFMYPIVSIWKAYQPLYVARISFHAKFMTHTPIATVSTSMITTTIEVESK